MLPAERIISLLTSTELIGALITAGIALAAAIASFLLSNRQEHFAKKTIDTIANNKKDLERLRMEALTALAKGDKTGIPIAFRDEIVFQEDTNIVQGDTSRALIELFRESTNPLSPVQELVDSYQRQALGQARFQYWLSATAAIAGFVLIIYLALASPSGDPLQTVLKFTPGAIIEAAAGLFFTQARETRQRATDLYDRLRTDTLQTKALLLVESITDNNMRNTIKAQLVLHMVGMNSKLDELGHLLAKRNTTD